MRVSARRSTAIGAVSGLSMAAVVVLLAWLNGGPGGSETLQTIINFFASLPTLVLSASFNIPTFLQIVLFFVYWVLVGGILGWLLSRQHLLFKVTALVLVVGLIVSHWVAQVKLEHELDMLLRAIGKALIGGSIP